MSGEILADDNSPMVMTVGQYNDRVAYTWKLATEAERERIIKLLEKKLFHTVYNNGEYPAVVNQQHFGGDVIELIKRGK